MYGPQCKYSESRLRKAYAKYKEYLSDQKMMRCHDYYSETLRDIMMQSPNLKSVEMSMEYCLHIRSAYMDRAFAKGMQPPYGDRSGDEPCGVRQLRSLLLGAAEAGLNLQTLGCGSVHWEFFKQELDVLDKTKKAMRSLHSLTLCVSTQAWGQGEYNEDAEVEDDVNFHTQIPWCAAFLKASGRMRDFVTATPVLQSLDISFDSNNPYAPASLEDFVGDFTWDSLKSASVSTVSTNEEELMRFFARHAKTLKKVGLDNVHLSEGSWPRVLQRMRKTLRLESAAFSGDLSSDDPDESFYLGLPPQLNNGEKEIVAMAIEDYLLAGGDGPLFDLDGPLEAWESDDDF